MDGVVGLEHTYGCDVAIDPPDAIIPIPTLRNIATNPNFGGEVMVLSLGGEKLQPERMLPPGSIPIADQRGEALDVVSLQDDKHVGFMSMIDSILTQATVHLERLNARRRETCPVSDLVVGVQYGGSDAFSGVIANPAVGYATDLLTTRAASPAVADAMVREMAWCDAHLNKGMVDRSANTTPGNRKVGCPTLSKRPWARSSRAAPDRSAVSFPRAKR